RVRGVPLPVRGGAAVRDRAAAPLDGPRPRPPVRGRHERALRGQREGAAAPRPRVHDRRSGGGGPDSHLRRRPAARGGSGEHGRARERRVEAPRQQGAEARADGGRDPRRGADRQGEALALSFSSDSGDARRAARSEPTRMADSDRSLGGRFWVMLFAFGFAGIGLCVILLAIFGWMWATWGLFG